MYPAQPWPSRTSAAAVASLVLGVLGCMPFCTGVLAIITGIVGISVTGNPSIKGRGMAIAGLILGTLSLIGWTGVGGVMWRWRVVTVPERVLAHQFISDLSQGNTSAAAAESTSRVTAAQLDAGAATMKSWGGIKKIRVIFAHPKGTVSGIIITPNNQFHNFVLQEVERNGAWSVDTFTVQP